MTATDTNSKGNTEAAPEYADIKVLRSLLLGEIFFAFGFKRNGWARRNLWPLAWLPAHIFSKFCAGFDKRVATQGFYEATNWLVPRFIKGFEASGEENVPKEGPLLVVSNHPGSIDSLVIAANIPRKDFKIVASDIPFIFNLPATKNHLIRATRDTLDRMAVLRASIEHLQNDGAMLIFPSNHLDPDPGILPGANLTLGDWSRSVELFLRKVPNTQLLISFVSNFVSPSYYFHPIHRIRKKIRDKQRLAQFIQLMQQMVLPGTVDVVPRVSFGKPVSLEKLQGTIDTPKKVMQSIAERAKLLMKDHMSTNFVHLDSKQA